MRRNAHDSSYIYLYPRAKNYCEQLQRYTKIKNTIFAIIIIAGLIFNSLSHSSRTCSSRERKHCSHQNNKNITKWRTKTKSRLAVPKLSRYDGRANTVH